LYSLFHDEAFFILSKKGTVKGQFVLKRRPFFAGLITDCASSTDCVSPKTMFHSLLYLVASIATVACGQTRSNARFASQLNMNVKRKRNQASCASLATTTGNILVNLLLFRVFDVLLRGPTPPLAHIFSAVVSSAVVFELLWFVGCTANQKYAWLENAGRRHASYNRWATYNGDFENAASLLDMHMWQSLCSSAVPYLATIFMCRGGYWVNLLLICQLCFRQYTTFKKRFRAGVDATTK
jgi:hypothetical protein